MMPEISVSARPWLAAVVSGLLMLVVTPQVMRLAWQRGWVARPRADRWSQRPTALMGGIALFVAAAVAVCLLGDLRDPWTQAAGVGAVVMFVLGLVDDRRSVMPRPKLITELACASLLIAIGSRVGPGWSLWVSVPLTWLWVIGITNALNLLDNMDGLAGGVAAIVLSATGVALLQTGETSAAVIAFAVAGACFGFLPFNFSPARVFMGDCGSLFLGFLIAALTLRAHGAAAAAGPWSTALLVPVALCAVLVADTTLVTISRLRAGRPVSQGGRDHASHRLVRLGLDESHAVLVLYGAAALTGVSGAAMLVLGAGYVGVSLAALAAIATGVAAMLRMRVYEAPAIPTVIRSIARRPERPRAERSRAEPASARVGGGSSKRSAAKSKVS